jgi:hypothetical protein
MIDIIMTFTIATIKMKSGLKYLMHFGIEGNVMSQKTLFDGENSICQ